MEGGGGGGTPTLQHAVLCVYVVIPFEQLPQTNANLRVIVKISHKF